MKKVYVNEAHFAEDSQTKTDVAITANQRSAKLHKKPVKMLRKNKESAWSAGEHKWANHNRFQHSIWSIGRED